MFIIRGSSKSCGYTNRKEEGIRISKVPTQL